HAEAEVLRALAALRLPPDRLRDLMPDFPATAPAPTPPTVPSTGAVTPAPVVPDRIGPAEEDDGAWLQGLGQAVAALSASALRGGASNAFAAAPARSAAGGSLLANDPHQAFTAPVLWYLARIELATGGVIGATIPGVPIVVAGRSDHLGWGVTAAWADDADIFIEELNPADTAQYRTPRGWQAFRNERSILRVAEKTPVTLTLRWTENGPVLPGSHLGLAGVTPPGHVASIAWTGASRTDTSMSAGLALMRARSVAEAMDAGARFVAPAQVLTVVDAERIAMQTIGALPDRDAGQVGEGRIPALGWPQENRWRGTLPFPRNPRFLAPASGVLGTTNNRLVDRPFPDHVSHLWGDSQRIRRLLRLLSDREVHTRESFIAAQLDTVSFTARSLLPLIARNLWFTGQPAPEGTPERNRQQALQLLANWNGEMNEHLPEPLIYSAWMWRLQARLITDELGPLARSFAEPDPLFIERVFRNVGGAAAWCDVAQSTAVESC
ncbi:MAG: penicillin acylase family protein, partial [Pseudomonadota bacterium]